MDKQGKTAEELDRLISEQFYAVQEVADDMRDHPRGKPVPATAYWHERDAEGRNWSVRGGSNMGSHSPALMLIVAVLQERYDIAEK